VSQPLRSPLIKLFRGLDEPDPLGVALRIITRLEDLV
jgi:hypothetical protein